MEAIGYRRLVLFERKVGRWQEVVDHSLEITVNSCIALLADLRHWNRRADTKGSNAPWPSGVIVNAEKKHSVFLLVGVREGIWPVKNVKLPMEQLPNPGLPEKCPLKWCVSAHVCVCVCKVSRMQLEDTKTKLQNENQYTTTKNCSVIKFLASDLTMDGWTRTSGHQVLGLLRSVL